MSRQRKLSTDIMPVFVGPDKRYPDSDYVPRKLPKYSLADEPDGVTIFKVKKEKAGGEYDKEEVEEKQKAEARRNVNEQPYNTYPTLPLEIDYNNYLLHQSNASCFNVKEEQKSKSQILERYSDKFVKKATVSTITHYCTEKGLKKYFPEELFVQKNRLKKIRDRGASASKRRKNATDEATLQDLLGIDEDEDIVAGKAPAIKGEEDGSEITDEDPGLLVSKDLEGSDNPSDNDYMNSHFDNGEGNSDDGEDDGEIYR